MKRLSSLSLFLGCAVLASSSAFGLGDSKQAAKKTAYGKPATPAALTQLFDTLLSAQAGCSDDGACCSTGACTAAASATEKLAKNLSMSDEAWGVVEPLMKKHFSGSDTSDLKRSRILDVLAWTPKKSALYLSADFLASHPQSFRENHLLAFAEHGSDKHEHALRERANQGECESIRPQAFFALHGDDFGKVALVEAAQAWQEGGGSLVEAYVAAVALEGLGAKSFLKAMPEGVHARVLAALDEGDLQQARELALGAEFFHRVLSETKSWGNKTGLGLSYLDYKVQHHVSVRGPELAGAEQIFELIESLTPSAS